MLTLHMSRLCTHLLLFCNHNHSDFKLDHFTQSGTLAEKGEIEEKRFKSATPEPIIEEPQSPKILQRGCSNIFEESESVEAEEETKPKKYVEENVLKTKPKRGRSLQIEEIEDETPDIDRTPQTPLEEDLDTKRNQKRGVLAQKENAEIMDNLNGSKVQKVKTDQLNQDEKHKGSKEVDEEVDDELEALLRRARQQRSLVEETPKDITIDEGPKVPKKGEGITHLHQINVL